MCFVGGSFVGRVMCDPPRVFLTPTLVKLLFWDCELVVTSRDRGGPERARQSVHVMPDPWALNP